MKKFDKNYIKYHLLVDFLVIVAIVVYLLFSGMEEQDSIDVLIEMAIVLGSIGIVGYILKTIYSFLYVKYSGYQLNEKEIIVKRGVLFKKTSVVEYAKMHAINKRQNIFQKLFKIAVLTADSGATHNSNKAEIVIIENSKTVDSLILKLKDLQQGKMVDLSEQPCEEAKEEGENLYSFTSKKVLLYSALNLISSLVVILILAVLTATVFAFLKSTLKSVVLISYKDFYLAFLMIAVCCLILTILLSFIISFIASFFTYYDFKVYKTDTDIEVNYGLLVRHINTFKLSKIKGVKISQGIIKRLFGYATVSLEVIGYVNENSDGNNGNSYSVGVLMPLCKKSEIKENLSKILPEYIPDEKQIKSVKYSPYVLWSIGFLSIFLGVAYLTALSVILAVKGYRVILPLTLILAFIYLITVLTIMLISVLSYKNNGIAFNQDKITIYNGSITKTCTVIKKGNIIAIEDLTTPLRKKAKIYTYVIHFRTNDLTNEIKVKNVSNETADKLLKLLKY